MKKIRLFLFAFLMLTFASCSELVGGDQKHPNKDEELDSSYVLQREDIEIADSPLSGTYVLELGTLLNIVVESVSDENVTYEWFLDKVSISTEKNLLYMFDQSGEMELILKVTQDDIEFEYQYVVRVKEEESFDYPDGTSPYITTVYEYYPAPGQFVNALPAYEAGDTSEDMCRKVESAIAKNAQQMISLGSYGGYVTVGFDHKIENKSGLCDFRVKANAFQAEANPDDDNLPGGSCEPGIIMVSVDENSNGRPDDTWYEIEGSAHKSREEELWYQKAVENNNDVNYYYQDFEITYSRPTSEPSAADFETYVPWCDNKGNNGYIAKNIYHSQCYYPLWIAENEMKFKGTRLPQNAIDESGVGKYFVLYKMQWGYADNDANVDDGSAVDISWAMDANGERIHLSGVDFIRVYTGVNQVNGWLGECSTEIVGIDDLHLLGEIIESKH